MVDSQTSDYQSGTELRVKEIEISKMKEGYHQMGEINLELAEEGLLAQEEAIRYYE
ncbi:MAG: hypothetical protein ACQEQI_02510 [Bacillota bacterium]